MPLTRRRRIGWTLAFISFVLAFAWFRSMRSWIGFGVNSRDCIMLANGAVQYTSGAPLLPAIFEIHPVRRSLIPWEPVWWPDYHDSRNTPPPVKYGWVRPGFLSCTIPLWPFILATGIPSMWLLNPKRKRDGCCGYPRDGLPPGSRCPECGAD